MIGDLTVVRWEDTTNFAEWSTPAEVETFARDGGWVVENVGWLVFEDDACLVLAARRTVDGAHLGLCERIPKRAVVIGHVVPGPAGTAT